MHVQQTRHSKLYNRYADQASPPCNLCYHAANHRNPANIAQTWQKLLDATHRETVAHGRASSIRGRHREGPKHRHPPKPFGSTLPTPVLSPLLERHPSKNQGEVVPPAHKSSYCLCIYAAETQGCFVSLVILARKAYVFQSDGQWRPPC